MLRHALHALSLLLLCATPSYGQRAAADTLVCFSLAEAGLLHDTLWSGVDHRRARVLQAAMIGTLREQLKGCETREALERQRADANARGLVPAPAAPCDSERYRRQRWQYLAAGLLGGAMATYILKP